LITPLEAIILGLVQGLTEFIPVSSSAHLNIAHHFLGHERNLTFDVMLHIGTLVALVWYFRHDWVGLVRDPAQRKLRNLILLGCVPAALLGAALDPYQESQPLFEDVRFNATMLIVAGLVLLLADRVGRKKREVENVGLKDALLVGCSQAVALIPGVSRSGSTMTMGLFLGLTRESAARFSFLMSLPITLGAVIFKMKDLFGEGAVAATQASPVVLLLGVLVSAASGFWAIGFLLNFLKKRDVMPFVAWRIGVALLVWALIAAGKLPVTHTAKEQAATTTQTYQSQVVRNVSSS
jgi:undecaprenyl-diphosphatase